MEQHNWLKRACLRVWRTDPLFVMVVAVIFVSSMASFIIIWPLTESWLTNTAFAIFMTLASSLLVAANRMLAWQDDQSINSNDAESSESDEEP